MAAATIDAAGRRVLWLHAASRAASPCDEIDHALRALDPSAGDGETSTPPDRAWLGGQLAALTESVAFFDEFGWALDEQAAPIDLPESFAPLLLRLLESNREEVGDYSADLVGRIEAGAVEPTDWHPIGDPGRDLADLLLEQSYYLWATLAEFGVEPPLAGGVKGGA